MKNFLLAILAIAVIGFLGWGIYQLSVQRRALGEKAAGLKAQITSLEEEIQKTESEIEYFSDPENLEKEARSQFNYRKPGEKMIIVIPGTSTSD